MATALNIKKPSVSKLEKRDDKYLVTQRGYDEESGGKLELTVTLLERSPVRIEYLDNMAQQATKVLRRRTGTRKGIA